MSGFDNSGSDGFTSGYGGGMLLPPIAQMAATDPRRLLVQSLIAQGHQAQARPMYSKFSALANALTSAAGPFEAGQLNRQYQGLNQDYIDQLRQAYGVNPSGNVPPAGPVPPTAAPAAPAEVPTTAGAPAPIQTAPLPPIAPPQATPALPPEQTALFGNLERQHGLPAGTLGRLMQTESSGQGGTTEAPRQGPPISGGPPASGFFQFRPDTAAKYGVTPGDMTSEATGAAQYLADLTKNNGGDFNKALAEYGGFKAKDPSKYIASVTGAPPAGPVGPASTAPQPPAGVQPNSQLAQALLPPQAAQPSASTGAPTSATDPMARQMAVALQMARNPNPLIAYQGIQALQALQQGSALAYQKGFGEKSGANAAEMDAQTGQAAQILAKAAPEAYAAALKAGATTPLEIVKAMLTPLPNRTTGGVSVPGLNPTAVAGAIHAYPALKGLLNMPGGQAGAPPAATASPGANAQSAPSAPALPVPYGTKSPADEVPTLKLPSGELPLQPGEIIPGRDPVAIKAGEDALEQAQHQYAETDERARVAATIHSQIANMRQQVTSGGVTPSMTGPARYFISSVINAVAGPEAAKSISGVDPAAGDVLSKEATQMGTQYARQTEGARQAVAGINIALKANPQLQNSKEGFLKILDILDAGAKHDLVSQEYGNAWFQNNQHYLGFQPWINQNHPPEEFISKVVPIDAPRLPSGPVDQSQLQPNVTYQSPRGPVVWTGQGFKLVPQ